MGIGDYNNGGNYNPVANNNTNNSNRLFETQYYSRLKFKNQDGKLAMGVSFRSGLLILDISEQKEGYNYESLCSIYLSPTKSGLLANEVRKFIEYYNTGNIVEGKAFGINAGMAEKTSFIGIHANSNKDVLITIGKVDSNGNITEQATIALNRDYHYALEWDNIHKMDVSKVFYDMTELDQLVRLLDDFSHAMNGVYGYSALDLGRYDQAKVLKKMDPIYDKLGIERKYSGNGGNNNRGGGYFAEGAGNSNRFGGNNNFHGSSNSTRVSLEELEDGLMGDD